MQIFVARETSHKKTNTLLSGHGLADFERAKGKLISVLGDNASYIV
jgi:hypothetical protein